MNLQFKIFIGALSLLGMILPVNAEIIPDNPKSQADLPPEMRQAVITEKLGNQVDIKNLHFKNEAGEDVALSSYFSANKPVIFTMVYFQCPGLCNYLLNGFTNSIRTLNWTAGKEFEVVTVSINPNEGPTLAAGKKAAHLKEYGRLGAENGWHFLTGNKEQIDKLASQIGFGYYYDKQSKEYAHSAGIFVLTPAGKVSRVLYGIDYPNRDLKLSLLEASSGKIGTLVDQIFMFCYKYDPLAKGYSFVALRVVQAVSALLLLALGLWVGLYWWGQSKLNHEKMAAEMLAQEAAKKKVGS